MSDTKEVLIEVSPIPETEEEVLIEVSPIPETEEQRKARELAEIKTEFGILVEEA